MKKIVATILLSVSVLSGCASVQQKEQVSVIATVQTVRNYQGAKSEPSGVNTAVGALGGGVLGNQVGRGNGRKLATVLGMVGGAVVGSQVGQKTVVVPMQELVLQMPDGRVININVESQGFFPGQRVEITTTQGNKAEIKVI